MARSVSLGSSIALVLFCQVACNKQDPYFGSVTPPSGQTLVFDNFSEPSSLDPAIGYNTNENNITAAMFEGLVQNDPLTTRPMAALATHYEMSPNGTQFFFYLRGHPHPGGIRLPNSDSLPFEYSNGVRAPPDSVPARWSDGTTITAHDFVYAWQRAADPRTAAPAAGYLSVLRNAPDILKGKREPKDLGAAALDDFTVRIDLGEPVPYLLTLLVTPVFKAVPRHVIDKARREGREANWTQPARIVTSGPFVLTEWRPYDYVSVRRSPTYYQADLVRLDGISFLPISADAAVVNLYRTGATQAMDTATLPEALTPTLLAKRDFRSNSILGSSAYAFNVHRPPFDNVLVRYALNMSVDKAAIARYLNQLPAQNFVPPIAGYAGPRTLNVTIRGRTYDVLQYNPVAARELLAFAGFPNGIGAGGRSLAFDLHVWNDATNLNVAQILSRQWQNNLRIFARLLPYEFNVAIAEMRAGNFSGLGTAYGVADFADPMGLLTPAVVTDFFGGWTDAEYVSMLDEANQTLDFAGRFEKLARAEARLLHEMPIIPLTFPQAHHLRKPYVHALDPDPLDAHYFRYAWIDTRWKP